MNILIGSIYLVWALALIGVSFMPPSAFKMDPGVHQIWNMLTHGIGLGALAIGTKALGWW